MNLVVVDSAKSSTNALLYFGVLTQLHLLFSFSTQRRTILKTMVLLSLKTQSANRWESGIHYISPLQYYLADVMKALKKIGKLLLRKNAIVKQ